MNESKIEVNDILKEITKDISDVLQKSIGSIIENDYNTKNVIFNIPIVKSLVNENKKLKQHNEFLTRSFKKLLAINKKLKEETINKKDNIYLDVIDVNRKKDDTIISNLKQQDNSKNNIKIVEMNNSSFKPDEWHVSSESSSDDDDDDSNNPQYEQFYSLSNYYNKVTVTKKEDKEEPTKEEQLALQKAKESPKSQVNQEKEKKINEVI